MTPQDGTTDLPRDPRSLSGREAFARLVEDWEDPSWVPDVVDRAWAEDAFSALGRMLIEQPAMLRVQQQKAERAAQLVSPRPFQGVLEALQNADDQHATRLRLHVNADGATRRLLLVHDGKPALLHHVCAMVLPWLSTKDLDAEASGRFGIGQKTLQMLGGPLTFHCHPFHVTLDGENSHICDPLAAIEGVYDPSSRESAVVVPLDGHVDLDALHAEVLQLGARGLLFLRHLRALTLDLPGHDLLELELRHSDAEQVELRSGSARVVHLTEPRTGHRYVRYEVEIQVAEGSDRRGKRTGETTQVGVAVPLSTGELGRVHDRVPMPIATSAPFFLNAQFDPDPGRTFVAETVWNKQRFEDLGTLLGDVAVDLRARHPRASWRAVPLKTETELQATEWFREQHSTMTAAAQARFVDGVELAGDRTAVDWMYEMPVLDGVVGPEYQRELHPERLPVEADDRDFSGRWRNVLGELDGPLGIKVSDALVLLAAEVFRDPSWVVRLSVAAVCDGLQQELLEHRCVVLRDGTRVMPPSPNEHRALALTAEPDSLGVRLGAILPLSAAYSDEAAGGVVELFRSEKRLVPDGDNALVLLRVLCRASVAAPIKVSDDDLITLRDAFEQLSTPDRAAFGASAGRNLLIKGFWWESGTVKTGWVTPATSYLPKSLEPGADTLHVAAGRTPGLSWVANEYAKSLKNARGRQALGARQFLALLGAETHPRLSAPHDEEQRYAGTAQPGVRLRNRDMPSRQANAVHGLRGGWHQRWLLEDRVSPALERIVADIQTEPNRKEARRRALALLAVLHRGWDRRYAPHADAVAAIPNHGWVDPESVPSTWLARLSEAEWLPNRSGGLAAPESLRLSTAENKRIYGANRAVFVVALPSPVVDGGILPALGLQLGPRVSELLTRLEALHADGSVTAEAREILLLLASACKESGGRQPVGDVSRIRFRQTFERRDLLPTPSGWRASTEVFRGPPLFGARRFFVDQAPSLTPLWDLLQVKDVQTADCFRVLREIPKDGPLGLSDRGVVMETMRRLTEDLADMTPQRRTQLRKLPLWTGAAWTLDRPLTACEDPRIAAALPDGRTLWDSGLTDLDGLGALLEAMGVERLRAQDLENAPLQGVAASEGVPHARAFASAVNHLKDELARGDQPLHGALTIPWSSLISVRVLIDPNLRLILPVDRTEVPVAAHVLSGPPLSVVARSDVDLGGEEAGRAIATLFRSGRQKIALAWPAMWLRAKQGQVAERIALSSDGDATEDLPDRNLQDLQLQVGVRKRTTRRQTNTSPAGRQAIPTVMPTKQLNDYEVDDGNVVNRGNASGGLVFPLATGPGGRGRRRAVAATSSTGSRPATVPSSNSEREQLAFDAVERALRLDGGLLSDLRARRGIGVDAVDELRRFYEIKMSSGAMPDQVTLTQAEVAAASEESEFFLAVVAGLADDGGELTVRFISDPLRQLATKITGDVILTGIKDAEALEYRFALTDPTPEA